MYRNENYESYYENGNVHLECYYIDDKIIGEYKEYDEKMDNLLRWLILSMIRKREDIKNIMKMETFIWNVIILMTK